MADHRSQVKTAPSPRLEVWLVGIVLAAVALLYRYAWIPDSWQEVLHHAEVSGGLALGRVGRWFSAWAAGDGQAFAVIAADPLGLDEGWRLAEPAYRYGRAGFGWLAWVASLGQEEWVPYGLAIVGLATTVASFLLAARLRSHLGVRAWLIAFNPAVVIALAGDTAEGLGALALAWALASGRWWASAALGVIRPTFLVALVGRWRCLLWGLGTAVTFGVLWILRFGFEPTQYGGRLGLPSAGYIEQPSLMTVGFAFFALLTLVLGLRHRDWGWVASALLVLCFRGDVLGAAHNGLRAVGMLFVLWAFGPRYSPQRARTAAPPAETTTPVEAYVAGDTS